MGMKKNKPESAKPVVKEKQPPMKQPAKQDEVKKEIKVTKADPPPPPIVEPVEKKKSDFDGIGIVGNHTEISIFKGKVKTENKKIGAVLIELISAYNKK